MGFPATMKIEDLDLKHEEFELLEGDFRLIELLTSGGAELRRNLDAVLHERPMEPRKLKEHRNALFNYNNIIGTVIGWYIAKLFENVPVVDAPESESEPGIAKKKVKIHGDVAAFLDDCDRCGKKFVDRFSTVARDLLRYRRVFVVVDLPKQEKQYANLGEQRAEGATVPYLVFYDPRHVINWGRDSHGKLQWIFVKTCTVEAAEDFPHTPTKYTNWWYFSATGTAHYRAKHDSTGSVGDEAVLISESSAQRLNVVEIEISEDHWLAYRSLLPAIKHLNLENALDWQLFLNALAILWIKGRIDEKPTLSEIGYLALEQDGAAGYLEQSGSMANILRERNEELREEIYRLSYVIQQGRNTSAVAASQSGISKEMDAMPSMHVCSALGDAIRTGMQSVLNLVCEIAGSAPLVVRGFDFPSEDASDAVDVFTKARDSGIRSDTLFTELAVKLALQLLGDQPASLKKQVEDEIRSGPTQSQLLEEEKKAQLERFSGSFLSAAA